MICVDLFLTNFAFLWLFMPLFLQFLSFPSFACLHWVLLWHYYNWLFWIYSQIVGKVHVNNKNCDLCLKWPKMQFNTTCFLFDFKNYIDWHKAGLCCAPGWRWATPGAGTAGASTRSSRTSGCPGRRRGGSTRRCPGKMTRFIIFIGPSMKNGLLVQNLDFSRPSVSNKRLHWSTLNSRWSSIVFLAAKAAR